MAVGFVLLTFVQSMNPFVPLPGVLVLAFGLAMLVAPITATALKAAPDRFAGLAAGVNTTVSRIGGLIAIPILGVVITLVFAADAQHSNLDPFATHGLSQDDRDATVTAFRAGWPSRSRLRRRVALALRGLPSEVTADEGGPGQAHDDADVAGDPGRQ
jgi:hypothetical protein